MIRLALLLMIAASGALAQTPPEVVRALPSDTRRLGGEDVRFWGFNLYTAELWTTGAGFAFDAPFALTLSYKRSFSAEELAAASVKEMARISGRPAADFAEIGGELEGCFEDVEAGDRITGLSHDAENASFYYNGGQSCEITHPEFARLFFGIWLGDGARDADIRERLLGRRP
jgi:hypothetical protein